MRFHVILAPNLSSSTGGGNSEDSVNNFLDHYISILYPMVHRETPVSLGAPCPYRPLCAGPIGDPFLETL